MTDYTTIQLRRDTKANWRSANPAPSAGEPCVELDTGKVTVGNGTDTYTNLDGLALDSEVKHAKEIADVLYDGVDLTVKHSAEITNSYAGNPWAWIKARIQAGNYEGIHVGDFIPFNMSAGTVGSDSIAAQSFQAQIAGIDTYYGHSDQNTGHHIDFITKTCINKAIQWNPTDNNNGTSVHQEPWLASKLYAYLNGVNNYSTSAYGSAAHGFDASAGGILQLLPANLQNVIVQKRQIIEKRYSASGLLTEPPGWSWADVGKLWVPSEFEVYGAQVWSGGTCVANGAHQGFSSTGGVAYPLFAGTGGKRHRRIKGTTDLNGRVNWWLSSVRSGSSTYACFVGYSGLAHYYVTSHTNIYAPVCFRVA